ncbi:geranylgeranyl reductase family protein [Alcanivorax sp. NBRC 102028]|jgi:geranylgeranyl reductase family protein|uniref:NAD(P)/FAD-dependent oxidoreductase n=1 Tax=Alcanivorax sp. NBRC 102028 TaxID=1113897 RepID=UPI000789F8F0|nr:geranylgeranyl reductase family protein [Alcanivorax sp. NBRC 102028]
MSNWDVLVIGAGQAGCAAAWDLAAAGLRVVVISRAQPRAKPCAGGVTEKTLARYRFSIASVVRETVSTLAVSHTSSPIRHLSAQARFCVMTERSELDALCRANAEQQGVVFCDTAGLRSLHQEANGVSVRTREGQRFTAPWLVAADGANSAVARMLGERHLRGAMAIEGRVPRKNIRDYPPMTLDFGAIRGGYGWLFPKGDHVNVGLYVWRHGVAAPERSALQRYSLARLGAQAEQVAGYPLGTWLPNTRLVNGRVLFVGDAAGCTEALLGEGIYGAVLSGQMAAQALLSSEPEIAYPASLAGWREELHQVTRLGQLFYGLLPISTRLLQSRLGATLVDGFAQGLTLGQCKRQWRGAQLSKG